MSATLANSGAALTSIGQTSARASTLRSTPALSRSLDAIKGFKTAGADFALSQIYVAGPDGVNVNGVSIDPLGKSLALLIPSDISDALPTKEMIISARDAASRIGPLLQKGGIPLAAGGLVKSYLPDKKTAATALLREANLDDLQNKLKSAAADLNLGPFKLAGNAKVSLENDGTATLDAYAELPGLKIGPTGGSIRADVKIRADKNGRLMLQGIRIRAPYAYLGAVKLKNLDLSFGNGLDIKGEIVFPPPISAGIAINQFRLGPTGSFEVLDVDYNAAFGSGINVGPGLFLAKLGGRLDLPRDTVAGRATVSVGPSAGDGCPTVGMQTDFTVHFAQPFSLDAKGTAKLACFDLVDILFHADQSGLVTLDGNVDFKAGPIFVKGSLGAALRLPDWQATLSGAGGIRGVPLVGTIGGSLDVVLSNIGLAACGTIHVPVFPDPSGGAAVRFKNGRPPFTLVELLANIHFFVGCDISGYRSVVPRAVIRAGSPGSKGFTIAKGTGPTLLSVEGVGGPPRVLLKQPNGQTLDFSDATGEQGKTLAASFGTVIKEEDRTVVILPRPLPGGWTAEVAPGSPPVARIQQARILPKAKATARVQGKGSVRTVRYAVKPLAGQTVRLIETAKDGRTVLKTIKGGGKGTVRFTVSEARSPRRTIQAEVIQDKLPRATLTLARFRAPNPQVGKVQKLRVRRAGRRAKVSWRPASFAKAYEVTVTYGVGRAVLFSPKGRARGVTVPGVQKREGLKVSVVAISPAGKRGRTATARLAGSLRVGKSKPAAKPKKAAKKKAAKKKGAKGRVAA